eukprot:Em0315g2a
MDKDFDCSIAELPDNQKKNRFDVHLPSNNIRVKLSGDKNQSDYICASFLDGYRQRSAFIITQAPMTETVGDFWRMIWEHKSAAIVMLAQLIEDGKCGLGPAVCGLGPAVCGLGLAVWPGPCSVWPGPCSVAWALQCVAWALQCVAWALQCGLGPAVCGLGPAVWPGPCSVWPGPCSVAWALQCVAWALQCVAWALQCGLGPAVWPGPCSVAWALQCGLGPSGAWALQCVAWALQCGLGPAVWPGPCSVAWALQCGLGPAVCGLGPAVCGLGPAVCGLGPAVCGLGPAVGPGPCCVVELWAWVHCQLPPPHLLPSQEVCVRYWPEETNHPEVFGKYQVEKSAEDRNESTYIIRKFKICSIDNPQDNRMITQFHYLMWPNRAAPENTKSIVELIDELQRMLRKSGNGPITVHCSDGIGRTGSFCAAYSMMDRFKVEQVVDAFQTIKSMRIQRAGLLDSLAQYIFLHSAVLEFLSTFDAYQNFK